MTSNNARYLAIDPGKMNGWATFDVEGNGITMGQCDVMGLIELLDETTATTLITEDYKLYPWKRDEQIWSRLDTVRIIGMIQYFCYKNNRNLILQMPNIKPIAYMWAGIKEAKSHKNSHERDAYVHGIYFLQKAGIRKPQQGAKK
jgi:hypothetical protein